MYFCIVILKKINAMGKRLVYYIVRPQGGLHFADVSLAQIIHADTGLADAAAYCIWPISAEISGRAILHAPHILQL